MFQLDTELSKKDINAIADYRFIRKVRGLFVLWIIVSLGLEFLNYALIKNHLDIARIVNWFNLLLGIGLIVLYFVMLNKNRKKVMESVVKNGGKMEYKAELDVKVKKNLFKFGIK